ncbi:hypothetical protein ACIQHY_32540, partial [Streptomyces sp. NPDC092359]|uniref:hypothetical protein n=1 Tax=Streptomyces sp. NPDC092359 TaxID=3366014 RepID=UPI00380BB9EA
PPEPTAGLRSRRSVMREPACERQSLTVTAQRCGRTRLAPAMDPEDHHPYAPAGAAAGVRTSR